MRPDLGEQLEINAIDRFGILPEEIVNRRAIGGGADASLATGASGEEKSDAAVRIRARMSRPHFIPIDHEIQSRGNIASIAPEFHPRVVGRGSPANRSDCGPRRAQFLSDTAIHSRRPVTRSQSQCRLLRSNLPR